HAQPRAGKLAHRAHAPASGAGVAAGAHGAALAAIEVVGIEIDAMPVAVGETVVAQSRAAAERADILRAALVVARATVVGIAGQVGTGPAAIRLWRGARAGAVRAVVAVLAGLAAAAAVQVIVLQVHAVTAAVHRAAAAHEHAGTTLAWLLVGAG